MKIFPPSVPPAQPSQVRWTECVIKIIPYNRNPQVCQDLSHQLIKPTWVKLNKTNNYKFEDVPFINNPWIKKYVKSIFWWLLWYIHCLHTFHKCSFAKRVQNVVYYKLGYNAWFIKLFAWFLNSYILWDYRDI